MMLTFFLKMDKLSLATTLNVISDSLIWTRHWILKHVSKYTIMLSFPLLWQLNSFYITWIFKSWFCKFQNACKVHSRSLFCEGQAAACLAPTRLSCSYVSSFMVFSFSHNHIEFDVLKVHWFFSLLSPISSHSLLGWKISLISSKNISFIDFPKKFSRDSVHIQTLILQSNLSIVTTCLLWPV